jgi:ankyrin repeat protein
MSKRYLVLIVFALSSSIGSMQGSFLSRLFGFGGGSSESPASTFSSSSGPSIPSTISSVDSSLLSSLTAGFPPLSSAMPSGSSAYDISALLNDPVALQSQLLLLSLGLSSGMIASNMINDQVGRLNHDQRNQFVSLLTDDQVRLIFGHLTPVKQQEVFQWLSTKNKNKLEQVMPGVFRLSSGSSGSGSSSSDIDDDKGKEEEDDELFLDEPTSFEGKLEAVVNKEYDSLDALLEAFKPFFDEISLQNQDKFAEEIGCFLQWVRQGLDYYKFLDADKNPQLESFYAEFYLSQFKRGKGWYAEMLYNDYMSYAHKDASYTLAHFIGEHGQSCEPATIKGFVKSFDCYSQDDQGNTFLHYAAPWLSQELFDHCYPEGNAHCLFIDNNAREKPLTALLANANINIDQLREKFFRFNRIDEAEDYATLLKMIPVANDEVKQILLEWTIRAFTVANDQAHLGKKAIPAVIEKIDFWNYLYLPSDQKNLWTKVCGEWERETVPAVPGFDPDHKQYLDILASLYAYIAQGHEDRSYSLLHFVAQNWQQIKRDNETEKNLENFIKESSYDDFITQDGQGNTFLHYAASWINGAQIVDLPYIIQCWQPLFISNKQGKIPLALMLAAGKLGKGEYKAYLKSEHQSDGLVLKVPYKERIKEYKDAEGNSLLHYAALGQNSEVCVWLKELGFEIDTMNDDGQTPWCFALQHGKLDLKNVLYKPEDTNKGILLQSALMGRCPFDDYLTFDCLVHKNKEGQTPVEWLEAELAKGNYPDLAQAVDVLKDALDNCVNADLAQFDANQVDLWLEQLKQIEEKYAPHEGMFKAFLERLDVQYGGLFLIASDEGDRPLLEFLVKNGIPFDHQAVMRALAKGHEKVENVQFLINHPDFRARAGDYGDVRAAAEVIGSSDAQKEIWAAIKKKLVELDAPLALEDCQSVIALINAEQFPLHVQALLGNVDYFNLPANLANKNINQKDSFGNTPLHYAIKSGNPVLVTRLLELGADVEAENEQKNRPLHLASIQNNVAMIDALVPKMPHFKVKNKRGETAEDLLNHPYADPCACESLKNYIVTWQEMVNDLYAAVAPKKRYAFQEKEDCSEMLQGRYEVLSEVNPVSASLLFELPATDVNGDTFAGDTLLRRAVKDNNVEVVAIAFKNEHIDLKVQNEAGYSVQDLIDRVGNPEVHQMIEAQKIEQVRANALAGVEKMRQEKAPKVVTFEPTPIKVDQPIRPEEIKHSLRKAGQVVGSGLGLLSTFIFFNKIRAEYARLLFINNREIKKNGLPLYDGNLWLLATKNVIVHFFNPPVKKKGRDVASADKEGDESSEKVATEGQPAFEVVAE